MTRRARALAGLLLGWVTLVAQVLLLRELWCVTWGSEALAGFAVAVWLAAGALGSALGGRALERALGLRLAFAATLATFALAAPGAVLLLRWWPAAAGSAAGEVPGLGRSALYAVSSLGAVGFLGGALFPLALGALFGERGGRAAASLYRWDMVGSLLGGAFLTGLVLAAGLGTLRTALLDSLVALLLTCWYLGRGRKLWMALPGALALAAGLALFPDPEGRSLAWRYGAEKVIRARETPAGRLILAEREGQLNAYLSGRFAGSLSAPERAEAAAAVASGECARPRRALLLGSTLASVGGKLAEYGAEVTAIVPDRAAGGALRGGDNPRLTLRTGDGRAVLRERGEPFDLIVIDPGSPGTFAQARLLTRECFAAAGARLAPRGVLAVVLPARPAHLSAPERRVAGSIWRALGVFPRRRLWALSPPGLVMVGFAPGGAPASREEVAGRLKRRGVRLVALAPQRLADPELARDVEERILPAIEKSGSGENRDARMVAALGQMQADRVRLGRGAGESFRLPESGAWLVLTGALVLAMLLAGVARARPGSAPAVCAFAAGLVGAGLEVAALVAYQVARGSLYAEVGLVLAAFMAGGAAGAGRARRWARRGETPSPRAPALALGALALAGGAAALAAALGPEGLLGGIVWVLLVLAAGGGVGATFAAAALHPSKPRPGLLYGLDLAGAAAGGLVAVVAVPWAGLATGALAGALLAGLAALGCGAARP